MASIFILGGKDSETGAAAYDAALNAAMLFMPWVLCASLASLHEVGI